MEIPIAAAVLLLAPLPYLWLRLKEWTLVDCFILSTVLYFGVYTLIDAALYESTQQVNHTSAAFVFITVFWLVFILSIFRIGPKLSSIREAWKACPRWPIVGLVGLAIFYRWITTVYYADLGSESLSGSAEQDLPYWFTSVGMLVNISILPVAWCCWGKWRAKQGRFWLLLCFLCLLVIAGMGRRAIFAFLLIAGWDLLSEKKNLKTLALFAIFVPVLIVLSNNYQAYRLAMVRGIPTEEILEALDDKNPVEAAADISLTVSNLQQRHAMWRFNYELVESHLNGPGEIQYGRILLGGLTSLIPSALYPSKSVFSTEEETLLAFDLEVYDRPENILANTYADFGLFSIVIAPALILSFVWFCGLVMRLISDPFLKMLLLGASIFIALSMEANYLYPVGVFRDFLFISLVYLSIRGLFKFLRYAITPQNAAV